MSEEEILELHRLMGRTIAMLHQYLLLNGPKDETGELHESVELLGLHGQLYAKLVWAKPHPNAEKAPK